MITAKVFVASKVVQGADTPHEAVQVTFGADYADGRNKEWAKATPYLNLVMVVTPDVAERFEQGHRYTLTFEQEPSEVSA